MTSGNQTCRNAHKKRSGASGEHPASRSAPRCPLRGVPGRRVLSIRACLRPGNALTPRRKCSNRAASNFNSRSPAHGFDVMFPISSAMQCGDEKNTQKTAVCRARSTHHTAAKLGQPIKKEKNRGITLSLSLSLSLSLCRQFSAAPGCPAPLRRENMVTDLFISHCLLQKNIALPSASRRRGEPSQAFQTAARRAEWAQNALYLLIGKLMHLL